jgi:hypothetical protein
MRTAAQEPGLGCAWCQKEKELWERIDLSSLSFSSHPWSLLEAQVLSKDAGFPLFSTLEMETLIWESGL